MNPNCKPYAHQLLCLLLSKANDYFTRNDQTYSTQSKQFPRNVVYGFLGELVMQPRV